MNYLVCIKQVPDTTTKILIKDNKQSVNLSNVKWIINPYDEIAIEEALRLSEKDEKNGEKSTIQVISIGPLRVQQALRTALAMGADKAIHIETKEEIDSLTSSQAINQTMKEKNLQIDIIFCGKHSIDMGSSCVGPMLASFMQWPSFTPAIKLEKQDQYFEIHQVLSCGGVDVFRVQKPFVLSVTKGMNEPRYPSLLNIMKAKSKPLEKWPLPSNLKNVLKIEKLEYLKKRPFVEMIEGSPQEQAQKLIQILKDKEKVL